MIPTPAKLAAFLLSLLLFSASAQAQVKKSLLRGDWVAWQGQRLDGSRVLEAGWNGKNDSTFLRYVIQRGEVWVSGKPIHWGKAQSYELKGREIRIGGHTPYLIEKLSRTELVLSEQPRAELPDHKRKRLFFRRFSEVAEPLLSEPQTICVASKFNSPAFRGNLPGWLNQQLGAVQERGSLWGSFILDPKGLISDIQIDSSRSLSQAFLLQLRQALLSTESYWEMPGDGHFFLMYFQAEIVGAEALEPAIFRFLPPTHRVNTPDWLSKVQPEKADQAFREGLLAIQAEAFEEAVSHFSIALHYHPYHTDALFNRAATLLKLERTAEACADYQRLISLGQQEADPLWKQFCGSNE
jgi:hypothetical protein